MLCLAHQAESGAWSAQQVEGTGLSLLVWVRDSPPAFPRQRFPVWLTVSSAAGQERVFVYVFGESGADASGSLSFPTSPVHV